MKHITYVIPLLFILVILSLFAFRKEGYHMDELLSFQLSNAEYNPWIVPRQPVGRLAKFVHNEIDGDSISATWSNLMNTVQDVIKNRGNSLLLSYEADFYEEPVWISRDQFINYITVDSTDDFNYLSVYFNVKDDNHPPFHFMLLHTISSLWKGKVKPFMGIIINIAAVLGICLLMIRIAKVFFPIEKEQFVDKKWHIDEGLGAGMIAALLYGLSSGAIATVLLIRMYGVMTFFCMALLYLHIKKWQDKSFANRNKRLIAVTILGFLTQYFFLFYCITLVVITIIFLWKEKRKKELICYVRSMVIAALLGVAIFPFAVGDVISSGRGVEALKNLADGFSGYGTRFLAFFEILLTGMFGNLQNGIIAAAVLLVLIVTGAILYRKETSPSFSRPCLLMLLLPPVCYFLIAARMSPYLVDRFIMPVFPFAIMGLAFFIVWGTRMANRQKLITTFQRNLLIAIVVLLHCTINLISYEGAYLYTGYSSQKQVAEENANLPCLCIYDGYGYYENLLEFTSYEKTLLLTQEELETRKDTESLNELNQIVVLTKGRVDEEYVREILAREYGLVPAELLVGESIYNDRIWLFKKEE